ncbi:MAG: LysR family transcriptional regulator [Gammaproteobacteria bacterium]|nr:LysR family transcriptional regulator [Gammaproteobacteria bacterium]
MAANDAHLNIRIDLANSRLGPGKAALLQAINQTGSISAAARSLGMSYARAWNLTESMNSAFRERLVETFAGGNRRGGAALTPTGEQVLELYERIRDEAESAVAGRLKAMDALRAP